MENDNSDATQIMDRVVENEIITTETPRKQNQKDNRPTPRLDTWKKREHPGGLLRRKEEGRRKT